MSASNIANDGERSDDAYWGEKARAASKDGYASHEEAMKLVLARLEEINAQSRPRPKRGSGKGDISYIAPDFDAPLEDMRLS